MLSTVLRLHEEAAWDQGLPFSLGDSLLCQRSALHRAVRRRLLELGYVISDATTRTKALYDCLPLVALESMLVERLVPYTDNVTALRDLVAAQPGLTLPVSFLVREISKNYLLHESCHCLAHEALFGRDSLRRWAKEAPIEFVLRMTLGEGFAVGTEFIAANQRDPAVALFGALSSYSLFGEAESSVVSVAVEQLGWDGAIRGAVYGAFLAQLILPGEPADGVSEIAEAGLGIAKTSDAYRRGFLPLVKAASSLAPGFCTVTVPTFLSFLGLDHTFTDREFRQQVLAAFGGVHKQAVDELCGALARAATEGVEGSKS